MVSFSLQWLAYPCFIFAIAAISHAIYSVATTWSKSDILPLIGVGVAVRDIFLALMANGLGWLIWRAFRQ